jgi:hypothetical protein
MQVCRHSCVEKPALSCTPCKQHGVQCVVSNSMMNASVQAQLRAGARHCCTHPASQHSRQHTQLTNSATVTIVGRHQKGLL